MGRLDWWNVKAEHSPCEWAHQLALSRIEPFGDDRDDLRAAVNTTAWILSQSPNTPPQEDIEKLLRTTRFYLKVHETPGVVLSPAQQRQLLER